MDLSDENELSFFILPPLLCIGSTKETNFYGSWPSADEDGAIRSEYIGTVWLRAYGGVSSSASMLDESGLTSSCYAWLS